MILVNDGEKLYFIYGSMLDSTTRTNTVTSYPTIEGTSFSDHYCREPEEVSFQLHTSELSKSFIYSVAVDGEGNRTEEYLSVEAVGELVKRWFSNAVRLEITTLRHFFSNMILYSYSWSDGDLAVFNPVLHFKEAKVQKMTVGVIDNPDQYYQAEYGDTVSVGGSTSVESPVNIGSALVSAGAGAAVGAAIGSFIPGIGTAAGAVVGGVIGFFGSIFG